MSTPVSAVVVNYNGGRHLSACVRSLRDEGVDDVVVVDNASVDGSPQQLALDDPGARVIDTGANLGYGTAANRGAAVAEGPYLLVCNADVVVGPGAVKALADALDAEPGRAVVGPRVENADGTVYATPRRFPPLRDAAGHAFLGLVLPGNRFTRAYRMLDSDHDLAAEVDWVSGSCFLARRTAWEALRGFDERYFMYVEDVDLCWRAARAGWTVGFEPGATVVHAQGVSSEQAPYRMIVEHHRSLLRFFRRSAAGREVLLVPVVGAGLALRAALACAQRAVSSARAN